MVHVEEPVVLEVWNRDTPAHQLSNIWKNRWYISVIFILFQTTLVQRKATKNDINHL